MAKKIFTIFKTHMRITQTSQNFYGCKNIIADDIRTNDRMITFIAAQLNDEGKPDLSEYRKLKTLLELPEEKVNNDSISILYTYIKGNKPSIFVDNQVLFWGGELKWLKENRPKAMPIEDYTQIEKTNLKAYSLLASITKRIMNGNMPPNDIGIKNVINSFMLTMTDLTKNGDAAFDVIQHAFMSKIRHEDIAENLNKTIMKTMQKFFK